MKSEEYRHSKASPEPKSAETVDKYSQDPKPFLTGLLKA